MISHVFIKMLHYSTVFDRKNNLMSNYLYFIIFFTKFAHKKRRGSTPSTYLFFRFASIIYINSGLMQHPFYVYTIARSRIVYKHMSYCTYYLSILNDWATTHSLYNTTCLFKQFRV